MNLRVGARLAGALAFCLAALGAAAGPTILAAAEDDGELLIIGRDFGASPSVRLGELLLTVKGATDVVIRAALPAVGVEPGSYALTVWRNALPRMPSEPFHVTLGAVGPKGDKGDPGGLGSIEDVVGIPCAFNGLRGKVSLAYGPGGEIRLRCVATAPAAKRD